MEFIDPQCDIIKFISENIIKIKTGLNRLPKGESSEVMKRCRNLLEKGQTCVKAKQIT